MEKFLLQNKDENNTVSLDAFYRYYQSLQASDSYGEVLEFIAFIMATTDCQTPRVDAEKARRFICFEFTAAEMRSSMWNGTKIQNVVRVLSFVGPVQYHLYHLARIFYIGTCKAPGRAFRYCGFMS